MLTYLRKEVKYVQTILHVSLTMIKRSSG